MQDLSCVCNLHHSEISTVIWGSGYIFRSLPSMLICQDVASPGQAPAVSARALRLWAAWVMAVTQGRMQRGSWPTLGSSSWVAGGPPHVAPDCSFPARSLSLSSLILWGKKAFAFVSATPAPSIRWCSGINDALLRIPIDSEDGTETWDEAKLCFVNIWPLF